MISPMLATIGDQRALKRKGYLFEPKLDGFRGICVFSRTKTTFQSRTGKDNKDLFEGIKIQVDANSCTLDGEIVAFDDEGKPDFSLMRETDGIYLVFDILEKDGKDLRQLPLTERKAILESTLTENDRVQIVPWTEDGPKLWKLTSANKLEGVIAKRKESAYRAGRSDDWVKIKATQTADCVILGYFTDKRKISSLALGLYDTGKLAFTGMVGTGFDEAKMHEIHQMLNKIPSEPLLRAKLPKPITWAQPLIVCEVKYQNVTKDKMLRAPVFMGLREDKRPEECTIDQL